MEVILNIKRGALKKQVGYLFKKERQKLDLTQEQLAELADLDANNLSRIERGEQLPDFITFTKLCQALQIDLMDHSGKIIRITKY